MSSEKCEPHGDGGLAPFVHRSDDDVTLITIVAAIVEFRWWIVCAAVLTMAAATGVVLHRGRAFSAVATFTPQSSGDPSRAGLAALAGQFGVSVGSTQSQQSPDYFAALVTTRAVLDPIVADSFVVDRSEGKQALAELLGVSSAPANQRDERTLGKLQQVVIAAADKKTGIVTIRVTTRWPVLSLQIAQRVLANLNRVNLDARQSQASEERRFTGQRLTDARDSLRSAENRLAAFLASNRNYQNSPELELQYQRLQREVSLQQQIVLTLAQAYEQARISEVRDIPVLVPLDEPRLPEIPNPPSPLLIVLVSGIVGGAAAGAAAFLQKVIRDPRMRSFRVAVAEATKLRDPGSVEFRRPEHN